MINLLPEQEKKELKREYLSRVVIVWLIGLSIISLIATVLLFPSYFLTDLKQKFVDDQINIYQDKEKNDDRDQIISNLKKTEEKIKALYISKEQVELQNVFNNIIGYSRKGIEINNMSYSKKSLNEKPKISISGVASTRDALLLFSKNLEQDGYFSDVELPVSNLAKDRNIDFKIDIEGNF